MKIVYGNKTEPLKVKHLLNYPAGTLFTIPGRYHNLTEDKADPILCLVKSGHFIPTGSFQVICLNPGELEISNHWLLSHDNEFEIKLLDATLTVTEKRNA